MHCPICKEEIKNNTTREHLHEKHPEYKWRTTYNSQIVCGFCGRRFGSWPVYLEHCHSSHLRRVMLRYGANIDGRCHKKGTFDKWDEIYRIAVDIKFGLSARKGLAWYEPLKDEVT